MGKLNTKGTLTVEGETFEGRIVTHHARIRVFGPKPIFDEVLVQGPDRLSRNNWSFTLEDGRIGSIAGKGCGCGGGR